MILFFGDSHARTFGLVENIVPFFVGPAAFNNFLSREASYKYSRKVNFILENAPTKDIILSYGSGIKHLVKSKKFQKLKSEKTLNQIADALTEEFLNYVNETAKNFKNLNIKIIGPIPSSSLFLGEDELAICKLINENLVVDSRYIPFSTKFVNSLFSFSDDSFYDFIHVTRDFALDTLRNSFQDLRCANDIDLWKNVFSINLSDGGEIKLWGGVCDADLRMNAGEMLDFRVLNTKTTLANQFVEYLNIDDKKVLVFNDFDLYLTTQLEKKNPKNIEVHNLNNSYVKGAFIKKLLNLNVKFLSKLTKEKLHSYEIIIFYNFEKVNQELKKKILELSDKAQTNFYFMADSLDQFPLFNNNKAAIIHSTNNKLFVSYNESNKNQFDSFKLSYNKLLTKIYRLLKLDV